LLRDLVAVVLVEELLVADEVAHELFLLQLPGSCSVINLSALPVYPVPNPFSSTPFQ
jgi:hypothetical protein